MKKRTLVIGVSSFDEVVKDTLDACHKARRGQPFGAVYHVDFPDQKTLFETLSPHRLELLRYLRQHKSNNERQIAKDLDISLESLSFDLELLLRLGLVKNKNGNGYTVPWDEITIQLSLAA